MAYPYQIIAAIGLLITIYGSGFWTGKHWAEGEAAIERQAEISNAVERAKVESNEQMKVAQRNVERRAAARIKQQKLEMELANDELAKNCHVSVGVFGVLQRTIDDANKAATGRVNGSMPVDTKPAGFLRGGFSAVDWVLGSGLPRVQPETKRLNGLDQ